MSTLRLLLSDSYDPWFNLAVEECIFRQMPATQRVLFLVIRPPAALPALPTA